jgi:predicted  nucleic acid-binding Zn-ribbon protein
MSKENSKEYNDNMNIYVVNNNSFSSSSFLLKEEDDEIVRSINTKKQTIPVTIYYIKKQLKFIHNKIKELKNKLENEILSIKE